MFFEDILVTQILKSITSTSPLQTGTYPIFYSTPFAALNDLVITKTFVKREKKYYHEKKIKPMLTNIF